MADQMNTFWHALAAFPGIGLLMLNMTHRLGMAGDDPRRQLRLRIGLSFLCLSAISMALAALVSKLLDIAVEENLVIHILISINYVSICLAMVSGLSELWLPRNEVS